jgi:hypothetical protein
LRPYLSERIRVRGDQAACHEASRLESNVQCEIE